MFVLCSAGGYVPLRSGVVELAITQHSHSEYWLNAFAHILGVEFVFAEIASTSQTIRTSFFTMFALVCSSDRFLSAKTHILCS